MVIIDGNKFSFPKWYLDEHADKSESSFWLAPINYPDKFERQERDLIKKHFDGSERVLEIGGFIGVTSCLINKIIADPKMHLVIELLDRYSDLLEFNRDLNGCSFEVARGQIVSPSNRIYRDWYMKAKSLDESLLMSKPFNTLIMDCEGAEFDFIDQYPEFIKSMQKLMIEWHMVKNGDRHKFRDKYVGKLKKFGFSVIESINNVDFLVRR